MMTGIVAISILAGMVTSGLAFCALKASWGFAFVEFRNALAELVAVPDIRREPEIQLFVEMHPVTDRSASVFLVYSLLEVPQTQDIASAWEGNYAPIIHDGHPHGVCRFYLN